jgi:hypothetical protein
MHKAVTPSSVQPRKLSDLTNLKSVPSPQAPLKSSGNGPRSTANDSVTPRYEKGNHDKPYRPLNFVAALPKTFDIS